MASLLFFVLADAAVQLARAVMVDIAIQLRANFFRVLVFNSFMVSPRIIADKVNSLSVV